MENATLDIFRYLRTIKENKPEFLLSQKEINRGKGFIDSLETMPLFYQSYKD